METKTLYFRTSNAEFTVEAVMSLPNMKCDILGGLEYYSRASGELVDEKGNTLVWRVGLTEAGKPGGPGLIEVEYSEASGKRPSKWLMHLLFEALDAVSAELLTEEQYNLETT